MLLSPKSNQHCFDWISLGIQQVRKPCIPRLDHLDSKVGDADCGSTMAKVCSLMVGWVFRDLMYDPGGSDLGQAVEIMNQCMNAWLNKQMKEWMDEIMNEWMHDWINEGMDGWMNEWMNGRKLHKMNERKFHKMNERNWHKMNEWTNERINELTSAESCLDVFFALALKMTCRLYPETGISTGWPRRRRAFWRSRSNCQCPIQRLWLGMINGA